MSLKFLVDRGEIKGSETFVRFIFPKQNVAAYRENLESISGSQLFCSHDRRNSPYFFQTWSLRTAKTRACLLRFSALKVNHTCAI